MLSQALALFKTKPDKFGATSMYKLKQIRNIIDHFAKDVVKQLHKGRVTYITLREVTALIQLLRDLHLYVEAVSMLHFMDIMNIHLD